MLGIRLRTFQYRFSSDPTQNYRIQISEDEQPAVLLTNVWNFVLDVKPSTIVTVTSITDVYIKSSENK